MKKKIEINDLRDLLIKGIVDFQYEKTDGTERKARGTLSEEHIPKLNKKDTSTNRGSSSFVYFDIEKNYWRSVSKNTKNIKLL